MAGFSWAGLDRAYTEKMTELKEERRRQEDIAANRENVLFELGLTKQKERSKYISSDAYRDAAKSVITLQERLKDENLDQSKTEYFNNLMKDPMAVKEALDFLDEQETKYNNVIPLQDLEDLFKIVNSNAPIEEKMDLVELITGKSYTGEEGKKNFLEIAAKLNSMATVPGRNVFTDITPGTRVDTTAVLTRTEKQMSALEGILVVRANNFLRSVGPQDTSSKSQDTVEYLQNLKDETLKPLAIQALFDMYMTPYDVYQLSETASGFRGFTDSIAYQNMIQTFNYPDFDISKNAHRVVLEQLQLDPSDENKKIFDLQFGPGEAERLLNLP